MKYNQKTIEKYKSVIEGYNKSDLSLKEYCQSINITPSGFYYYKNVMKNMTTKKPEKFLTVNLPVDNISSDNRYEICLKNGLSIKLPVGIDFNKIQQLIHSLD